MTLATRTLGEICDEVGGIIRTGPFGSQLHESDYREEGTPVIMPKDIVEGKVSAESIARIGEEDVARLSQHALKRGEIVYGRRGDIGRRALITEREAGWLCGTGCLRVSLGETVLDPQFLFYYLGQPRVIEAIAKQAIGATLPNLNTSIIRSIPITYPPLPIQRRIASILSAYDDLIENNTRRIKILEQMTQAIYREWFVEFRAPGVKLRKATPEEQKVTGKDWFPVGWELKPLKDLCEQINYGYTASARQEPVGPKFLRITDIVPYLIDWDSVPHCEIEEKDIVKYRLEEGDVVIARTGATTGYAKRLNKRHPEAVFASYLVRIRVRPQHSNRLIGLIVESDDYKRFIKANLGGAAQPQANAQVLTSIPVVIPTQSTQESFDRLVEDILDQREVLQVKNANLRQTRDLLLPRLVSGEVNVKNIAVEV